MTQPIVAFTEPQLQKLLETLKPSSSSGGVGLGAPARRVGVGCGPDGFPVGGDVGRFLEAGSPRLALAKAMGIPFQPQLINVRATFPTVDTADVPDVGSDVKITQDSLVDCMVVRLQNSNSPANSFSTLSDFFFNFQSGIEATLDVQGQPRYSVAERFTPLSTLADVVNGGSHWPHGWILNYQQQLFMSFHANVTLPTAPYDVICTFRVFTPTSDIFVQMTNREALARLAEQGITCDDAYSKRVCR